MRRFNYVATSRKAFIQQLVSGWVRNGYYFYVQGEVPEGKDPTRLDEKFLFQYPIRMTAAKRYSRKKRGLVNVAYLRFDRHWVMLATKGTKGSGEGFLDWHRTEGKNVRNCRNGKQPIKFFGYSISYVRGDYVLARHKVDPEGPAERDQKHRVRVQISRDALAEIKATILDNARRRGPDWFRTVFWNLPYEPYEPVKKQLFDILRQVNAARAAAGMEKISSDVVRQRFKPVKVFE